MALPPAIPDFLGRGWSFPPVFSKPARSVEMVEGLTDIHQSLTILLGTAQGERVMLPTYGCDLWKYVFRDLDTSLLSEIRDMVGTAVTRWEPRIQLLGVDAVADADVTGLVRIEVQFRVRRTNTRSNVVFPFYLNEATLLGT